MKPKATHTSFRQGQKVFVKLRSGEQFTDKFQERKGRYIHLQERGKIENERLASVTIYRPV